MMKPLCFFIVNICFSIGAQSQGVQFHHDTSWKAILFESEKSGKLVFVDVYTDWCGPCQRMNKEVFPLKEVGEKFNNDFINYQLNAEKGEGPALKNKYHVTSYPTYLFLRGDGTLIYKVTGAMNPHALLNEASKALAEVKQPITISQMDSLYPFHQKDKDFMYDYVKRRTQLGLGNANLLDEYFNLLNKKEQSELKNLQLVVDNGSFLKRSLQIGTALHALLRNKDKFQLLKTNIYNNTLQAIVGTAKEKTLSEAIKQKNTKLLQKVLELNNNADVFSNDDVIKLHYFWGTKQYKKYFREAKEYVSNQLMTFSDSALDRMDKQEYDKIIPQVDSSLDKETDLTEEKKKGIRYSYRRTRTVQVTKMINNICNDILVITNNPDTLRQCLPWIQRCIHLAERDTVYFNNVYPFYLETYARFLYKTGNKSKGIRRQQQLVDLLKKYPKNDFENDFENEAVNRLNSMKNNEILK